MRGRMRAGVVHLLPGALQRGKGPMSEPGSDTIERRHGEDILTLAEAASLLRVEEAPLAELAAQGAVPAQKIGTEWRFLREALVDWLRFGPRFADVQRVLPYPAHLEMATDRLLHLLEQRVL